MTKEKLLAASQIDYHQFEGHDATLRITLNNGVEIEVTNGRLHVNFKDRFNLQIYEHDADEGGIGRPYDSVIVHPDGWRVNRKEMTAYNFSKDGESKYPPFTEEELTKRAIESYEACVIVTDKTQALIDMEKRKSDRLIAEAEKEKKKK